MKKLAIFLFEFMVIYAVVAIFVSMVLAAHHIIK